jgi:hypothetical protein
LPDRLLQPERIMEMCSGSLPTLKNRDSRAKNWRGAMGLAIIVSSDVCGKCIAMLPGDVCPSFTFTSILNIRSSMA